MTRSSRATRRGSPMLQGLRDARLRRDHPRVRDDDAAAAPDDHLRPRPVRLGGGLPQRPFTQRARRTSCCVIIVAGDFIGLTDRQLQLAPLAVNDINRAPQISREARAVGDRLHGARDDRARPDGDLARVLVQRPAGDRSGEDLLRRRIARRDHGQHVHGVRSEHHARRARGAGRRVVDCCSSARTRGRC